jgi:uncharacterized membrane-anchored protein
MGETGNYLTAKEGLYFAILLIVLMLLAIVAISCQPAQAEVAYFKWDRTIASYDFSGTTAVTDSMGTTVSTRYAIVSVMPPYIDTVMYNLKISGDSDIIDRVRLDSKFTELPDADASFDWQCDKLLNCLRPKQW